jgi:hypothetical protein
MTMHMWTVAGRRGPRASGPGEHATTRARRHPWLLGVSLASALCVAYLIQSAFRGSDISDRSLYANLGMIPIGLAATVVARSAALAQSDARSRWGWRLIAAAFLCFCSGDVLFFVYQNILGLSPFPSLADAGYLTYYPLMLAGLLWLPRLPLRQRRLGLYMAGCAVLLVGGAAAVIKWLLLPTLGEWSDDHFAYALAVGYPIGDLLLLAGVSWTMLRRIAGRRATVILLTAGIGVGLLADIVYGYQNVNGTSQPGGLSDALYMGSWMLYAWGAYAEASRKRVGAEVRHEA